MSVGNRLWLKLKASAVEAARRAYCPYSRFPVGAAILTKSGRIFAGCNVENASYGLTICAERSAIFQAVAHGDREMRALLIYTPTPTPTIPCGACRQVLSEFGPEAEIVCICDGPVTTRRSLRELLPDGFGAESLCG